MSADRQPLQFPTFTVIGAMRAGTTTLHYDLQSHPEVVMSRIKEPNFFAFANGASDLPLTQARVDQLRSASILEAAAYKLQFQALEGAKAFGDVSPTYLFSELAARQLKETVPSVRIVVVLRDPVDRAYSQYLQRSGIDPDPSAFVELAEKEYDQYRKGAPLEDYSVILGSLYSIHLKSYVELFSQDQILIQIYETFWPDYPSTLSAIHEFVGVQPLPPQSSRTLNKSGVSRSAGLEKLLRGKSPLKDFAKSHLPDRLMSVLIKSKAAIEELVLDEPPEVDDHARSYLLDTYFVSDIDRLEDMIGKELSIWRH